jgi:hypothetical protein
MWFVRSSDELFLSSQLKQKNSPKFPFKVSNERHAGLFDEKIVGKNIMLLYV